MNKYKYLLQNVLVFCLGNVVSKVVQFFLLSVFTAYLTPQEFGDAELIITTISLLIPIFTLSISDATLRFLFEKGTESKVIMNSVFITLLGIVLLLAFSPIISCFSSIRQYVIYIIILYIVNSIELLLFSINKGYEQVKICALNSLVSVITLSIFSYTLICYFNWGILGYIISIILSHCFCIVFLIWGGRLYRKIQISSIDKIILKQMLCYSIPFVPSTIAWWFNSLSDRYLIVLLLGSTYNGLYSVASKIPNVISIFTTIFHQAWQLSGIREYNSDNYSLFYSNIYNVFSSVIFMISSILIVCIPYLGNILFKGQFAEAWSYVPFLVLGSIFSGLSGALSPAYLAAKRTKALMYSTLIGALVNIIINVFYLQKFGLQIASISTFVSFFIVWIIRLWVIRRIIIITVHWATIFFSTALIIIESFVVLKEFAMGILYTIIISFIISIINIHSNKIFIKAAIDRLLNLKKQVLNLKS